jgi:hypothetical protein
LAFGFERTRTDSVNLNWSDTTSKFGTFDMFANVVYEQYLYVTSTVCIFIHIWLAQFNQTEIQTNYCLSHQVLITYTLTHYMTRNFLITKDAVWHKVQGLILISTVAHTSKIRKLLGAWIIRNMIWNGGLQGHKKFRESFNWSKRWRYRHKATHDAWDVTHAIRSLAHSNSTNGVPRLVNTADIGINGPLMYGFRK